MTAIAPPGDRAFRLAVTGDIGSDPTSVATLEMVGRRAPDAFLALGDFSYRGPGSERAWCDLVRSRVGARPFVLLAGNHEEDTGEDGTIETYVELMPDPVGSTGEYGKEYWFDIGDLVRIIAISPNLTMQDRHYYYGHDNANIRWLTAVIDDARERGIRSVVIASHTNSLSMGPYYCDIHQDLLSLLIEKRVDLVLHAHDHLYQRTKQLRAPCAACPEVTIDEFNPACVADDGLNGSYRRGAGTVFVTAGAGGAELYPIDEDDPQAGYFAAWMGSNRSPTHGFVEVTIGAEEIEVAFVPTSDGAFRDRFAIGGKGAGHAGALSTPAADVQRS